MQQKKKCEYFFSQAYVIENQIPFSSQVLFKQNQWLNLVNSGFVETAGDFKILSYCIAEKNNQQCWPAVDAANERSLFYAKNQ